MLVYSGDHDLVIPFTATRTWVYGLGLPAKEPYSSWRIGDQVAGFRSSFSPDLSFATIKGGGHMVPQSNPREALELISRFIKGVL